MFKIFELDSNENGISDLVFELDGGKLIMKVAFPAEKLCQAFVAKLHARERVYSMADPQSSLQLKFAKEGKEIRFEASIFDALTLFKQTQVISDSQYNEIISDQDLKPYLSSSLISSNPPPQQGNTGNPHKPQALAKKK